jgi:hypothetical protein
MTALEDAIAFFYERSGFSVCSGETEHQGRLRSARELAEAEAEAWLMAQPGMQVTWEVDPEYDANDYDVDDMPAIGWGCVVSVGGERTTGHGTAEVASLWGITFEGDGEPWGKPYARVVVAELASELMPS